MSAPLASVEGKPVSFDDAVAEAARLIGASAAPLFAHLGTDVEGAREAVLLAEQVGAVLDHAQSGAMLKTLDPIRESGGFETTPLEAAARADVVLWVGPPEAAPEWLARPPSDKDPDRHVIWLGVAAAQRLSMLAAMRACVKQRPLAKEWVAAKTFAETLAKAKFGVAMWSAGELAPLAIEAVHGLVRDLNETTRFSTLPVAPADNGAGVQTVCGWMTGFPLRTGFGRGWPEHDPWRFDGARLIASGETDCRLWVSAFDGGAAPLGPVEVALCAPGAAAEARVRIEVAQPGVDHDAILYDPRVGGLVACTASAPSTRPSVAATLAAIRARTPC